MRLKGQWQAQEGAHAEALPLVGASAVLADAEVSEAGEEALSEVAGDGLVPPLKSVAYQPEPLS